MAVKSPQAEEGEEAAAGKPGESGEILAPVQNRVGRESKLSLGEGKPHEQ